MGPSVLEGGTQSKICSIKKINLPGSGTNNLSLTYFLNSESRLLQNDSNTIRVIDPTKSIWMFEALVKHSTFHSTPSKNWTHTVWAVVLVVCWEAWVIAQEVTRCCKVTCLVYGIRFLSYASAAARQSSLILWNKLDYDVLSEIKTLGLITVQTFSLRPFKSRPLDSTGQESF